MESCPVLEKHYFKSHFWYSMDQIYFQTGQGTTSQDHGIYWKKCILQVLNNQLANNLHYSVYA